MKNNDDTRLLAHKQEVDAERRAQAVLKQRHQVTSTAHAMAKIAAAPRPRRANGRCLACGAIEVNLNRVDGYDDLSSIGESPAYPYGYGCELCS
jgi:hypothetical protein